eukprot:Skav211088  [mRNA]  locus=scaffold2002:163712:164416:+ [translate_table: standard]
MFKAQKFPVSLEPSRSNADLGGCGLYGTHELCKDLLKISKGKSEHWVIHEIEWSQSSLSRHTAIAIAQAHEARAPKSSAATEVPVVDEEDFSMFYANFLDPSKDKQTERNQKQLDQSDDESDFAVFQDDDDACWDELDGDSGDLQGALEAAFVKPTVRNLQAAARAAGKHVDKEPTPSEAGSRTGQVKTIATQMDLVEQALRKIHRPESKNLVIKRFRQIYPDSAMIFDYFSPW